MWVEIKKQIIFWLFSKLERTDQLKVLGQLRRRCHAPIGRPELGGREQIEIPAVQS
jgi:hypothetical protein